MKNEPFAHVAVTGGALSVINDRYPYFAVSQMTEPDLQTSLLWWWLKQSKGIVEALMAGKTSVTRSRNFNVQLQERQSTERSNYHAS